MIFFIIYAPQILWNPFFPPFKSIMSHSCLTSFMAEFGRNDENVRGELLDFLEFPPANASVWVWGRADSKFKQRLAPNVPNMGKPAHGSEPKPPVWPYILLRRTDPIWWLSNPTRLADFSANYSQWLMALLLAWPLPPAQTGEIQVKREGREAARERRAEAETNANASANNYKQL